MLFRDRGYLKSLADCWTHDLEKLIDLSGLKPEFGKACGANPVLDTNWGVAKDWEETSRYEQKTKSEAEELFNAITNEPNGVLPWIQARW
jgi:hypothetical protein